MPAATQSIPATLIPGDGIGPEVTEATLAVLDAIGVPFRWQTQQAGMAGVAASGDPLPPETLDLIRKTRLALKGPLTTPVGGGFRSSNVRLREEFELYANLRPARTIVPGGRYDNIDLVLVRENLEGLYVGFEHYIPVGDDPHAVAMASGVNTRAGARRIAEFAFDYAVRNGRKKVTIVHKANVLKALTGLFLEAAGTWRRLRGPRGERRAHHRRLRDAARDEPVAVRRHRHDQPLRRHPLRRDRGPGGRPRHGARGQHRRRRRDLRGGARLGARHRRARASPTRWRSCSPPR